MGQKPKTSTSARPDGPPAGTLEEWRYRAIIRDVTLPSGMVVDVRAVPLDELAAIDGLPTALERVALLHAAGTFQATLAELVKAPGQETEAETLLTDNRRLLARLVRLAIAGPPAVVDALSALAEDDLLDDIDGFDRQMVAEIAQRLVTTDAAGRRVYGAQDVTTFPGTDRER